jgi:hypothetical protein
MATATRSDVEVGAPEARALDEAIAALRPYSDHPTLGGLVEKLRGGLGAPDAPEAEGETLAKALTATEGAIVHVRKQETRERIPGMLERLEKSARDLERELAFRSSVGYANSERDRAILAKS